MKIHRPGLFPLQRIYRVPALFCLCGLLLPATRCRAAQEPRSDSPQELTIEQYRTELDRCARIVDRPSEIPQLQESLPPSWTVRVGDTQLQVPTEPILAQLRKLRLHSGDSEANLRGLRLLLNGMRQEAADSAHSRDRESSAKTSTLLQDILHRKEFRTSRGPSASEILMAKINRWLVKMIAGLISVLPLSARVGSIFVWGVIVLAFLALCYLAWSWLSSRGPIEASLPAMSRIPSDVREWVKEAFAAAERGDYRAALHCAYWGAIVRLEDLGRLNRDRARTPREALHLLENHSSEHHFLQALTGIFERVWYGYRAASEADWTGAKELLEKIGCLEASTAPTANF